MLKINKTIFYFYMIVAGGATMYILLITNNTKIKTMIKKYYKERYPHILIDVFDQNIHIQDLKREYIIVIIDTDSLDFSGVIFTDLIKKRYKDSIITYLSDQIYDNNLYPRVPFFYMLKKHLITDLNRLMYFYYGLDQEVLRFKNKTKKYNRPQILYQFFKIDDVLYIESQERECVIHKKDGDTIIYMTIGELERQLIYDNKEDFLRVHKCFVVNLRFSQNYKNYRIYFNDSLSIPVGNKYRDLLREKLFYFATNNE